MADGFPVAGNQVLRLAVLGTLGTELFQVGQQLGRCVYQISFEVFEGYEDAKFFGLR